MLEIKKLTKKYNNDNGVFDFSYRFEEGKIYSIVGPNGAGKTTLIKAVAGITSFQKGTILLDGVDTKRRECKKSIGYALDFFTDEKSSISVEQFLHMVCEIKYNNQYREDIRPMLKAYGLEDNCNFLIRNCSMGMKKKVGLIATFLGNPKLIILDEPTNGIDTSGLIILKEMILKAKENGQIVIVSSHILDFVDAISDEILFLKKGHLVTCGSGNSEEMYKQLFLMGN